MMLMVSMPTVSARVVRATAVLGLFVLSSCARGGDSSVNTPATQRAVDAADFPNSASAPVPAHASSPTPAASPPVVTVMAYDYAFSTPVPSSVPAGPVTFRMINAGKELHMMGVVWLGAHTFKDFMAAVQGDSTFPGPYGVGGPNAVVPGDTSYATVILEPGHVALACWVDGEDGKMHVMKGMMTALDVAPAGARNAEVAKADVALTLRDYAIDMSGAPAPGHRTFRVENRGPAVHDVELFRMEPGATMADVEAWLQHPGKGSSKARPLGGMVGIEHGHHGWFTADLAPGDYVLVCLIPGEKGVPHYAGHGMLKRFHVTASSAGNAA